MALKKETIERLKAMKIDPAKLEAAIKSDKEEDLELPEGTLFTDDDLAKRDDVKLTEGKKTGEKEAQAALIKEVGKKLNFEPKGERMADLIKDIQERMNATNDDKVKTLTEQVNLLTQDKDKATKDLEALQGQVSQVQRDYDIMQEFPKRKSLLNDKEYLGAIKGMLEFKEDGVYKDGKMLRDDKTQAPLSRKDAIATVFKERSWVDDGTPGPDKGGRGGGDNPGGGAGAGFSKMSDFRAHWQAQNPGKNTMSPEFTAELSKVAADNPQFNMYD